MRALIGRTYRKSYCYETTLIAKSYRLSSVGLGSIPTWMRPFEWYEVA
jgi:hypothetical protein